MDQIQKHAESWLCESGDPQAETHCAHKVHKGPEALVHRPKAKSDWKQERDETGKKGKKKATCSTSQHARSMGLNRKAGGCALGIVVVVGSLHAGGEARK